ncbi:MAG: histidine phosphatase family protein [Bacteroidetes bacterium]|nr:histidine phosphatase family protein [Bacteroidota bacterium]
MKSIRHRIGILCFFLCALAWSLPACGQSTEAPTVVMVFRHAEPVMPAMGQERDPDPSLNEAGQQRAEALIETVAEAGVTAIYSSQLKRTQETVAPLAAHLGLDVTTVEISRDNLADYPTLVAEQILAEHRGETVVVVNHSNTVPLIVEALGGAPVPEITENEFDHFIVVVVPASGSVQTIRAQYGH